MSTSLKKFIQQIAGKKAPGPSTTFTIFHVFYALELLSQEPLGRNKLANKLEVGDGAVRTIISRLKDACLIETSKEGCSLTEKGHEVWQQFIDVFPIRKEFDRSELTDSPYNFAFLVKNCPLKVGSGINQRDAAIIAGARKALVLAYRGGHLCIESVCDCIENVYPKAASLIVRDLKPTENDLIVIASADSPLRAKRGAFAASWSLVAA